MSHPDRKVAIVDDDVAVLSALARLLRAYSFTARTYVSADEFIKSLAKDTPDCLVVDIHMPNMDGIELQEHLLRVGVKIPTIVITAHNEDNIRARCDAAGALALIFKPLPTDDFLAAINDAMIPIGLSEHS